MSVHRPAHEAASKAAVNIAPSHVTQIECGLADLSYACVCLSGLILDDGMEECAAVLALVQKAGARLEMSLRAAGVLTGPAVVGSVADWLDMVACGGEDHERA